MSNFDFLDPGRFSTLKIMHFLLLQKLARVPLKNRFRLAIIIPGKCKYILLNKKVRICNYLQCTCKYIPQGLSDGFHVVPRYPRL